MLWIGGPPGSGKTTVATRLARRHGLRWYNTDAHTWAHRDRALEAGNEAARRWEAMTPDERRDGLLTDAELLELSLHRERLPMVVDDLARLPASPLTIAEGTVIAPTRAVWLIPTPELQRAWLTKRGQANRLYTCSQA